MSQTTAGVGEKEPENRPKRRGKFVSDRGAFEIFANPSMLQALAIGREGANEFLKDPSNFDLTKLIAKNGEQRAREKFAELLEAYSDGVAMTELLVQDCDNGMSLVHTWMGAKLPFYAHSHWRYGDCTYYVMAGEMIMGSRRLGPGSGFFLPCGMPYKFSAGSDGLEFLEFRAEGLGDPKVPDTTVEEHSLEEIQRLIDTCKEVRHLWVQPSAIGGAGHRNADARVGT